MAMVKFTFFFFFDLSSEQCICCRRSRMWKILAAPKWCKHLTKETSKQWFLVHLAHASVSHHKHFALKPQCNNKMYKTTLHNKQNDFLVDPKGSGAHRIKNRIPSSRVHFRTFPTRLRDYIFPGRCILFVNRNNMISAKNRIWFVALHKSP